MGCVMSSTTSKRCPGSIFPHADTWTSSHEYDILHPQEHNSKEPCKNISSSHCFHMRDQTTTITVYISLKATKYRVELNKSNFHELTVYISFNSCKRWRVWRIEPAKATGVDFDGSVAAIKFAMKKQRYLRCEKTKPQ